LVKKQPPYNFTITELDCQPENRYKETFRFMECLVKILGFVLEGRYFDKSLENQILRLRFAPLWMTIWEFRYAPGDNL